MTKANPIRILIVEDSIDDYDLLKIHFEDAGIAVATERVDNEQSMRGCLRDKTWDVILADHSMPKFSADAALKVLKETGLDIPLIIVSGVINEDAAVAAMRAGASDFIGKSSLARLLPAIEREVAEAAVRRARRKAEDALGKSEERFRLMIERIKDYAILMLDADGLIIDWNFGAERITGYTSEDVVGQHIGVLFSAEDRKAGAPEQELEVAARDSSSENVRWHYRKNGDRFWAVGYTTALRDADGKLRGFAKILQDATERKAAEEEKEKLLRRSETANRMKDEFLATLSHELRTPLHVIIGNLQIIDEFTQGSKEYLQSLDAMKRNATAQLRIVNDLLDTSRIISGKLALKPENVDMRSLVQEVVQSQKLAFEAKHITVETHFPEERLAVMGDSDRLQQVLWNLVSNAIKFTPPGGWCRISGRPVDGSAEIAVEDNGKGLDPEFLSSIFERFRQEDGSTTRAFGGLGLGLAIARHILEMHGGTIRAESEGPGKGARFIVRLPSVELATSPTSESALIARIPRKRLAGVRVLAVDDQADARAILENYLAAEGANVTAVASADEALLKVQGSHYDLLIADIGMPNRDGYFLIKAIRKGLSMDSSRLVAIALTAYASDNDRKKALELGYDQHIAKPVQQRELVREIAKLIV